MLTTEERDALESSAIAGDAVVHAAFKVAVHSQDLDYLSALFKDIASQCIDSSQVNQLSKHRTSVYGTSLLMKWFLQHI